MSKNYKTAVENMKNKVCFSINTLTGYKEITHKKIDSKYQKLELYVIQSYNTVIAYLYNDVLYMTKEKYTRTTGKHKSLIRQAFTGIYPIKEIENDIFQQQVNLPKYKCDMSYCFNYGEFQQKDFGY